MQRQPPLLVQPVLPDGIRWDFGAGEGLAVLSMELEVPWGCQHLHHALGGDRKLLGAPCPAQPQGIHTSSSWHPEAARSDLSLRSSRLLEEISSQELDPPFLASEGKGEQSQGQMRTLRFANTPRAEAASLGPIPALALSSSWGSPSWDKYCWPKNLGACSSGFFVHQGSAAPQEHAGSHRTLCQRLS